jgi:glycosyltransferase involved in cell wall biosynthesis
MKILQLTCHYRPNVGGVETHLDDLVRALLKRKHEVFVLTYRPLTTKAPYLTLEQGERYTVFRIPWLAGFFYKLVKNPILEFLYLVPGLFLVTPYLLLLSKPDVIHAHGLVAGFVGVFWGKALGIRTVISTHSMYHFPEKGLYTKFVRALFTRADVILTLSKQSAREVEDLGIRKDKIHVFTYWIDLSIFKPESPATVLKLRKKLGWENKFVVLFVGRLIEEKGIPELIGSLSKLGKGDVGKNVLYAIVGSGPMEQTIKDESSKVSNLHFLGRIEQDVLPEYYNASDALIVPSTHEEGFGRVILESLACGTPVIASNRGAIPEAMDERVGRLIDITPFTIAETVEKLYKNKSLFNTLKSKTRKFAEKKYAEKNIDEILRAYKI